MHSADIGFADESLMKRPLQVPMMASQSKLCKLLLTVETMRRHCVEQMRKYDCSFTNVRTYICGVSYRMRLSFCGSEPEYELYFPLLRHTQRLDRRHMKT